MMSRKKDIGMLMILLLIIISILLVSASAEVILEKTRYELGEQVLFGVTSEGGARLEVVHEERVFRLLGEATGNHKFYPEFLGEYTIFVINKESEIISSSKFFVESEEVPSSSSSNVFSTNKKEYKLGEEVKISLEEDIDIKSITIISEEREYAFVGVPDFPVNFYPSRIGGYLIILRDARGNIYESSFETISSQGYIERPLLIDKYDAVPVRVVGSGGVQQNVLMDVYDSDERIVTSLVTKTSVASDLDVLERNNRYNLEIRPENSNIKMNVKGLEYRENINIGLEELKNQRINGKTNNRIFSLKTDFNFEETIITSTAIGTELLACDDWSFEQQTCIGEWEKVMDLTPGEDYELFVEGGENAYAETGVASINTKKSIYKPGEIAEIVIVVLDRDGYLVPNADIELNVTSPNNETFFYSTNNEIVGGSQGVYFVNHTTTTEGNYLMSVHAIARNTDDSMTSFFVVKNYFEFDIVRNTPVTIDPYQGPFESRIKLTSFTNTSSFSFTEILPSSFTIHNQGGAIKTVDDENIYLTWHNLNNNSEVFYEFNSPFIIPYLWELRSFVEYQEGAETNTFWEARPWYLAIDPINYYDPTSDILTEWSLGNGISYTEISGSVRQDNTPNIDTYIASTRGTGEESEFGFSSVVETGVEEITLWVYTSTGNSVSYTFSLRRGTDVLCSNEVPDGVGTSWRSCTWENPSGDLSDLSVYFGVVQNEGGRGSNALVYAAYVEVDTGTPPPEVTLDAPAPSAVMSSTPVSFNFTASDETYSTLTCSLYTNVSGSWGVSSTINNVNTDTLTNVQLSPSDGTYVWNVECENADSKSAFAENNRTVYVNAVAPLIENEALNETQIRQNRSVRFNVSITDSFGIDTARITVDYPDSSISDHDLLRDGDEFYFIFTDTMEEGVYNVTKIWANDSLGQSSEKNTNLWFEVEIIPPTIFDLLTPANATESRNLNPTMTWEETDTPDFDNYTLIIDQDPSFGSPDHVYSTHSISSTSYTLDFALSANNIFYWKVIAYDVFGNSRESTNYFMYINDRISPTVSLENPANEDFVTNSLVEFSYTPNDANTLDYCELLTNQTGAWEVRQTNSEISKNQLNYFSFTVPEGPTLWNVRCYDEATNMGTDTNRTVILDTSGPVVTLIIPEDDSLIDDTNIVTFTGSAYDELSSVDYCELLINGSVAETNTEITSNVNFNFTTFLSNNYYEWNIRCFDDLGNSDVGSSRFLTVESLDNDPPVINLLSPSNNAFINFSTILFSYSVSDATGIESCSLFVDGEFEQQSNDVINFAENNFSVSGFFEDYYNWSVSCVDNSSESNAGFSSTRFFTVDLTNPVVTLNGPGDDAFLNFDNVDFVYTPIDDNLNQCYLYTNFTGSFEETATHSAPDNNVQNTFNINAPSGVFVWNVLCDDLSSRESFASENFSLSVDTEAPKYSDVVVSPSSPVDYAERIYYFNISWTDNFGVETVILEHNFSGSFVEEELFLNSGVYNFSISNLDVGVYSYRWFANDSSGNENLTSPYTYVVNKAEPNINLYLNSVKDNVTIDESNSVNLQGEVLVPSNGYLELYLNNDLIDSGTGSISNNYFFGEPGTYNVTLVFNETSNYLQETETFFVFVNDITDPVITLISPSNDSLLAAGTRSFTFRVNDSSVVESCELYINNTLNKTVSGGVQKNVDRSFSVSISPGSYSWRVQCKDEFDNEGVSETRTFTAVDDSNINVYVSTTDLEYEDGETAVVVVNTTDAFSNSLQTNVVGGIIKGGTSVPWWSSDWKKRQQLEIVEDEGNSGSFLVGLNLTNLSINSCSEVRIINHSDVVSSVVPYEVYYSGADWCYVVFFADLEADETLNTFYAYYNNSGASNPNYDLDLTISTLFNPQESAADEGTPQDVQNLVGKTDDFARMTQGGGQDIHSAHGRAFINETFGPVEKVEIRYRYSATSSAPDWSLRYSIDDGTSYAGLFTGSDDVALTTSPWQDITNQYDSLSWSELNRTRLQGRVNKQQSGGSITLDVYWVEMNVTHERDPEIIGSSSDEEVLVSSFSGATDGSCGCVEFSWSTLGVDLGLYSSVVVASADTYNDATSFTTFDVVPDATPPNVTLISPADGFEVGKGLFDFSYVPFDYNLANCSLFIGLQGNILEEEVFDGGVVNNVTNTFSDVLVDIGVYEWNVQCFDLYNNSAFAPDNFVLNVSAPDLVVSEEDIWFVYSELIEGVEIEVFANITNEGLSSADEEFDVDFYLGDPLQSGELIGSSSISSLSSLSVETVNASFTLITGSNNIFVVVDSLGIIEETDTDNNVANNTLLVELYQYYFGSSKADIVLGKDDVSWFIKYSNLTDRKGHVFFTDVDASFSFSDLQALTRNVESGLVSGDFTALDEIMDTSDLKDSIKKVWGDGSDNPVETRTFDISSGPIHNVPIVSSTEYEGFVTGILWDTSDDSGNERFDVNDKETIVFVTEINPSTQGRFGIYDFEIRVPATLRTYSGENERLAFYIEIK